MERGKKWSALMNSEQHPISQKKRYSWRCLGALRELVQRLVCITAPQHYMPVTTQNVQ